MARIRSIHPGFFTDEAIVSASPLAQIFLIGLWTQCDDQGVFEWKPLTLKMRILPATNCDVAVLLAELAALDVIKQIDVGSLKYGLVRNFRKFQRPKKPNAAFPLPAEFRTYVGLGGDDPEPGGDSGDTGSPPVPHQSSTGSEISPQMEEGGGRKKEGRDSSEEPNGSSGGKPPSKGDLASRIFDEGRVWLREKTGFSDAKCRKLLGSWRSSLSDSELIEAIGKAQREGVQHPESWFQALINVRSGANGIAASASDPWAGVDV